MSFIVTYNGVTDISLGCHAKTRPSIPAPERRVTISEVPGRDGAYYDDEGVFDDIEIEVTFSFRKANKSQWHAMYRSIKNWLLSGDNGELRFSDDSGYFYKVRMVQIKTSNRIAGTIGEITAVFTCQPYAYVESGTTTFALRAVVYNDYDLCHPVYYITGNGTCTLTVNGNTFVVTVGENVIIDTDRMLTYRDDNTWVNTTATGDYEDLYFAPGRNELSISSGFSCSIRPNWRCL